MGSRRVIVVLSILGCSSGPHAAGGDGGSGSSDGGSGSGACMSGAPSSPVAADRSTAWNPGILTDDQLHLPLGADGLPVRTTVCATLAPGGDIQAAIDACAEGQVVKLAAGTYTVARRSR